MNDPCLVSCLVGGVFAPRELLPICTDPLPKHLCLVGGVLLCNVTKSLKEAVTDPTWVQSAIATSHGMW